MAITRLRMPPFIVTLTSMMFFSGLAIWLTQSKNIGNLPPAFNALGARTELAFVWTRSSAVRPRRVEPLALWTMAICGRAQCQGCPISGVPVAPLRSGPTLLVAFVPRSLRSCIPDVSRPALLSWVNAFSSISSERPSSAAPACMAAKARLPGRFLARSFLTLLDNSLNLLNLSYFTIMMAKGAVILLAAIIDARTRQLLEGD